MEQNQVVEYQADIIKKILKVLLASYFKTFTNEISEEELEAIATAITQHNQECILGLTIHKIFNLVVSPDGANGMLYFHSNSISLIVQEGDSLEGKTKTKTIPVSGERALIGKGNTYTLYSIFIPIVRVINILSDLLAQQAEDQE